MAGWWRYSKENGLEDMRIDHTNDVRPVWPSSKNEGVASAGQQMCNTDCNEASGIELRSVAAGRADHSHAYSTGFLEANDEVYRWLVERALRSHAVNSDDCERTLQFVRDAAAFAGAYHTGRLSDGALENVLLEIGERWCTSAVVADPRRTERGVRHVLHVASQATGIAGHTKMIGRWVASDATSVHSLAVTASTASLPASLRNAVLSSRGQIHALAHEPTLLGRCRRLRALALQADLVVLHHDGHDVTPTVALADDRLPAVAVLNHADHQFWLGSSVCDLAINLRSRASKDLLCRQVEKAFVLPVPLGGSPPRRHRAEARRALRRRDQDIVLLSVARALKFRPSGGSDFLATTGRILDANPDAHLYIVGETLDGIRPFLRTPPHERIHFVGPVDEPQLYRDAADVYLETFPFGSQTALLEAALTGVPVVRACAPLAPLLVADDDAINSIVPVPASEVLYVEEACRLMSSEQARLELGRALRQSTIAAHIGRGWLKRLASLYEFTDELTHRPRRLAATSSSGAREDVSLSYWQAAFDGRGSWAGPSADHELAAQRHAAHVARFAGNMGLARWKAWQALRRAPSAWASWRLFGVSVLGRSAARIRRFVNMVGYHGRG
jgi:glycosyltransferase involved in cell wall biosynthesis